MICTWLNVSITDMFCMYRNRGPIYFTLTADYLGLLVLVDATLPPVPLRLFIIVSTLRYLGGWGWVFVPQLKLSLNYHCTITTYLVIGISQPASKLGGAPVLLKQVKPLIKVKYWSLILIHCLQSLFRVFIKRPTWRSCSSAPRQCRWRLPEAGKEWSETRTNDVSLQLSQ